MVSYFSFGEVVWGPPNTKRERENTGSVRSRSGCATMSRGTFVVDIGRHLFLDEYKERGLHTVLTMFSPPPEL